MGNVGRPPGHRPRLRAGIGLFATEPIRVMRDHALTAERAGYAHAWFGDSQCLWREIGVTMGVVAEATERIVIGTGVSNALTRHLSVIASTWLSLHELSGGRVAIGLGAGDSAVKMVGRAPQRLAELERDVAALRGLLAGDEVTLDEGTQVQMGYAVPAAIPLYMAASGPKLLELAGRIADGIILLAGVDPAFVQASLTHVERGAAAAGRTLADIDIVLWTPAAILDDGHAARDLVKSHVARVAMHTLPAELDEETMATVAELRRSYDYRGHMATGADHSRLVPDSLVDHFAIAGTGDECAEQVRALLPIEALDEIAIVPYVPTGTSRSEVIERFIEVVDRTQGPGPEGTGE